MNSDIVKLTIELKFCNISYHDKDWVEHKTKCDYTIWNVMSGSLKLTMDDCMYTAQAGDVLLFHPGDTYSAKSLDCDCSFLVTFFTITSGNGINVLQTTENAGVYKGTEIRKISKEFTGFYQKNERENNASDIGLYAAFLKFYAELSRHFGEQEAFKNRFGAEEKTRLISLAEYIDKNVEKDISVRDLAGKMGMSEKYFSNYFHFNMGMTPKQYLVKAKMNHAVELLSDSGKSLKEIAEILHFSDQYSFAKAFKNYYGEAPGAFRKAFLQ